MADKKQPKKLRELAPKQTERQIRDLKRFGTNQPKRGPKGSRKKKS